MKEHDSNIYQENGFEMLVDVDGSMFNYKQVHLCLLCSFFVKMDIKSHSTLTSVLNNNKLKTKYSNSYKKHTNNFCNTNRIYFVTGLTSLKLLSYCFLHKFTRVHTSLYMYDWLPRCRSTCWAPWWIRYSTSPRMIRSVTRRLGHESGTPTSGKTSTPKVQHHTLFSKMFKNLK